MSDNELIKQMADLLKSGATLLNEHCPQCNSPLFKVKGNVRCLRCNKSIVTVKEGEEQSIATTNLLNDVEKVTLTKINEVSNQIMDEKDISNLERLSSLLVKLLEALEKMQHFQKK